MGIFVARRYGGQNPGFSWAGIFQQWTPRSDTGGNASRPLLTGHVEQAEEVDDEQGQSRLGHGPSYGAVVGSGAPRPRVQPSGLQPDRNEWQDV